MITNQTIDGVPRELLERIAAPYRREPRSIHLHNADIEELRALMDAPDVETPIPEYFIEACDKFDWTPEEALRFYADGKHYDTAQGRTRILCTGAIASHALKGIGGDYAGMKGIDPVQPQSEPMDDCETFEYQLDMLGPIDRCNVSCGSYGDKYHQWDDAGPYVEYEDHVKHIELYKREVDRLSKLYAEQPATVAVAPERSDKDYAIEHAEFMATSADNVLAKFQAYGMALLAVDEGGDDGEGELLENIDSVRDDLQESLVDLRGMVYEFRKRAHRANTPQ